MSLLVDFRANQLDSVFRHTYTPKIFQSSPTKQFQRLFTHGQVVIATTLLLDSNPTADTKFLLAFDAVIKWLAETSEEELVWVSAMVVEGVMEQGGSEGHPRNRDGAAVLIVEATFAPFIPPGLREGTPVFTVPLSP